MPILRVYVADYKAVGLHPDLDAAEFMMSQNIVNCAGLVESSPHLDTTGRPLRLHSLIRSVEPAAIDSYAKEFTDVLEQALLRLVDQGASKAVREVHSAITGALLFGYDALADSCGKLEDAVMDGEDVVVLARQVEIELSAALRRHLERFAATNRIPSAER